MADPCSDLMHYHRQLARGGPKLPSVSPLDKTPEEFAHAMLMQKRDQIEQWRQENGSEVPGWLLDDCSEWRTRWLAKFCGSGAAKLFDELSFGLLLKELERKWSDESSRRI